MEKPYGCYLPEVANRYFDKNDVLPEGIIHEQCGICFQAFVVTHKKQNANKETQN